MRYLQLCCLSSVLVLAGCASAPEPVAGAEGAKVATTEPKMVCVYEAPTGSRLRFQRCKPADLKDEETRRAQEMLDNIRLPPPRIDI